MLSGSLSRNIWSIHSSGLDRAIKRAIVVCPDSWPESRPVSDSDSLLVSLSGPMQARNSPVTSMSSTQTQVAAAAGTTYDNLSKQLQEWTQTSITNLYNLNQDPQTQSLFAPDAQITVNGDKLSPEKYDEQIKEVRAGATHIDTVWGDILSVPEDKSVRYRLSSVTDAPLTCAWNSAPYCSKDLTP